MARREGAHLDKLDVAVVKKSNLYESIADTLERMILDDSLKVGERLPSETTMAENFGVSRNIIREAMKILKERHLVELRNGDGARVVKPNADSLNEVIRRMVAMGSISLGEVYEIRRSLEVAAAGLAAHRATPEQIANLYSIVDEMARNKENKEEWIRLDLHYHAELAKSSGNPLFYEFIKPLSSALEIIFDKGRQAPGALEKSIVMHTEITRAIEVHDVALAEEKMREHLRQSSYDSSFEADGTAGEKKK